MKTRSNMPLFVVETNDVKALSNSQIDLLRCGDYLVKKDVSGEHAYKVTYKSDTGMCLTYMDASVIETQSYDKVDGNWVYNSEDKTIIAKSLENIVDAQGHKRFVSGDITINPITGVTQKFGKWILSGGHLLIVVACELATGNTIADNTEIAKVNLPDWIKEKLVPIRGTTISLAEVVFFNQEWGFDVKYINLRKDQDNIVEIENITGAISYQQDRPFRIAFDLAIDYDEPEQEGE